MVVRQGGERFLHGENGGGQAVVGVGADEGRAGVRGLAEGLQLVPHDALVGHDERQGGWLGGDDEGVFTTQPFSTRRVAPSILAPSSSMVAQTRKSRVGRKSCSATCFSASITAASPPFMSDAPRP